MANPMSASSNSALTADLFNNFFGVHGVKNGADVLCETLLANDLDVCFANPGTSEMHFVAALDRQPRMRCVLGLFEGVVTAAADGYARMADKPAVTLLHLGPGLANGLANLHNARRARTPIVNVVGDHASYHLIHDAPLTSDIEGLARPMSNHVRRVKDAADVSVAAAEAVGNARRDGGQVSTLILPADAAWSAAPPEVVVALESKPTHVEPTTLRTAVEALRNGKKTLILVGGKALRSRSLEIASRIARHTGAELLSQGTIARMERGQGRVKMDRVPYSVDLATRRLAAIEQIILVDTREPVAFFAYPGKPSQLMPKECQLITLTRPSDDLEAALSELSDALGAQASAPDLARIADKPTCAAGTFDAAAIIQVVAATMPENTIICDESVTSGGLNFSLMTNAAPHDYLALTGGAIGIGLPLAAGAAIGAPGRKVITLQADGSAMYTVQALWTQARENLDVVTVIFANRRYAILYKELELMGGKSPGENARRMLDLDAPALDWVLMARASGVEATRIDSISTFTDVLRSAVRRRGPFLIEAII
jgi:acetolactate synthase-1/2/3 large subunit